MLPDPRIVKSRAKDVIIDVLRMERSHEPIAHIGSRDFAYQSGPKIPASNCKIAGKVRDYHPIPWQSLSSLVAHPLHDQHTRRHKYLQAA